MAKIRKKLEKTAKGGAMNAYRRGISSVQASNVRPVLVTHSWFDGLLRYRYS